MKTFWITGASSGIGEALALRLASEGNRLILSARNVSKLNEIKNNMPDPTLVHVLPFDLRDIDQDEHLCEKAWSFFGGIDAVILNAGLSQRSLVEETEMKVYRELMEVNYFGNIGLAQKLLPYFLKANQGQFVVISSLVGKFGTPYRSGYSASKHALHGFFDSLRAELMMKDRKIDVTVICPGFVSTNISFNALGSHGEALGSYDEANANGLTPADFASRAVQVIKERKMEAYIGGKETVGVYVKRLFPDRFARMIAKAKVR